MKPILFQVKNYFRLSQNKLVLVFVIALLLTTSTSVITAQQSTFSSSELVELPELPTINGDTESLGFAGMLGGMSHSVVIAGGGANFPENPPWKDGAKVWYDDIYFYKDDKWTLSKTKLPFPIAYSACTSTEVGIICVGGDNSEQIFDATLLINFDREADEVVVKEMLALPEEIAYSTSVSDDGFVYVIGGKNSSGSTNIFYRLNIETQSSWEKLPDFPGPARAVHSAAVQDNSDSRIIYIVGGRNETKGEKSTALSDYISYDLHTQEWKQHGALNIDGAPRVIMGAAMEARGSMHLVVYGGSDELLFDEIENLYLAEVESDDPIVKAELKAKRNEIVASHSGFSKDVLAYNTITDQWFREGQLKNQIPVTNLSFQSGSDFYIISGEVAPGVRTPSSYVAGAAKTGSNFGLVNYIVLFAYLLVSLLIGIYFSRKQKSTEDYFVGGGRVPWWASGLSVFGTLLSAITFMAIPAKAFLTDWSYFFLNMAAIVITPLIAFLFIPYFSRLKVSTAYEFLENRFNYLARAFGSLSFILFQLGRIGIVLLLPSLAISIVTGISVETSILIMGIICIVYTTFGGIEAVIWTDVLQVIVLMGGSIVAVVWILLHTDMPVGEMITYASDRQKINMVNLDFNFTETTFWVVFIGGLASAMVTQGTDQTVVQRYLTSNNVKDAQKTLYTNAVLTLPASIIFFGIGTLLFIFYTEMPQRLTPDISNNDSIFPWYIVNELPIGISGLLIAGIFSAAMSSISSSLNSVSTAFSSDFYKRFRPEVEDVSLLRIARFVTAITGVLGIILALWMANSDIKSLWDEFYRFLGLFTGGLGGMFLLGLLTKRANATGTLLGLAVSALLIWYVSVFTEIHILMYSLLGVVSCFVTGYLFSLIFKEKA
ncbi:sodium:solute symporter family transporter [Portibacter lacus]|uniref:Sodium:solute symporter n=1 Tax=Portibacter lacus TaxID=1099794 RepID=A0AA37SNT1_9BACT|nr:sodium/solute symporter [Portibacter lacus]GLR15978.1 sodium:solute symporter [Portibacter lacus]